MNHADEKTFCETSQFILFQHCGLQEKHHGVWGLSKYFNLQLYNKMVHGKFTIH